MRQIARYGITMNDAMIRIAPSMYMSILLYQTSIAEPPSNAYVVAGMVAYVTKG